MIRQGQEGLKPWIFEHVLSAIEADLVSSTWRVSSGLGISQFNVAQKTPTASLQRDKTFPTQRVSW